MKNLLIFLTLNLFILSAFSDVKVVRKRGKILINGTLLTKSSKINVGDLIHAVGKKSFIQIKTDYGSNLMVRNGKLKIEEISKKRSKVNLLSGEFFHYLKKKSKRDFSLKTPNAVMGVRGTKYYVDATKKDTYLCVCEGIVEAAKLEDKNFNTSSFVNRGEDIHINAKGNLDKTKATKQMLKMTYAGFEEMGFPVEL